MVAAGCSLVGSLLGSITSYDYASTGKQMLDSAKCTLLSGYVRKSAGQSASKLLRQGRTLASTAVKLINTGKGISSVTGTLLTWGIANEYSI